MEKREVRQYQLNMKLKKQRETVKLSNSSITKVLPHPDKNKIIVADQNGKVSFLTLFPLKQAQSFRVFYQYCTSMCSLNDSLLLGSSEGELVQMKLTGEIVWRKKLHDDCISSILECESYIVTTGYDGVVLLLKKIDFEVEKRIELNIPIWSSYCFHNNLFLAGNPSFEICLSSYQIKKLKRFESFAQFKDKLYANSDERGLLCLKNNSNSYIPCNFILPLDNNRMIIFSEQCATQITHDHQMQWKCHRIKQIQKGSTITTGFVIDNVIVIGDSNGTVYRLEYEISEKRRQLFLSENISD